MWKGMAPDERAPSGFKAGVIWEQNISEVVLNYDPKYKISALSTYWYKCIIEYVDRWGEFILPGGGPNNLPGYSAFQEVKQNSTLLSCVLSIVAPKGLSVARGTNTETATKMKPLWLEKTTLTNRGY